MENYGEAEKPSGSWPWDPVMSLDVWGLYRPAFERIQADQLRFAMGGGFAFSYYSRRGRTTKDIDLYIKPDDRERMIEALAAAEFEDYYSVEAYDRAWIYRGVRGGVILDIIWQMVNGRALVDDLWLTTGPLVDVDGIPVHLLPPEEFLWAKLYVIQRDRCDWPDLLNVLYLQAAHLNWERILERISEDVWLVSSLMGLFGWLCPQQAQEVPSWVWTRLGLSVPPLNTVEDEYCRASLLDSRDWFGPTENWPT